MQTTFGILKMANVAMETTKKNTKNFKCSELDETFQKFCLTCVHIILRLRNFRMAALATKNVKNFKCSDTLRSNNISFSVMSCNLSFIFDCPIICTAAIKLKYIVESGIKHHTPPTPIISKDR